MAGRPRDLLVIGAGPAGLGAAAAGRAAGLEVEVVEAGETVAESWRTHYDRLHLHTTRRLSSLPGRGIPASAGTWVSRDEFITYLEDYARGIPIRFRTRVRRLERSEGGWTAKTQAGRLSAPHVVVATGYNNKPHIPSWAGLDGFTGELVHSSAYRNPGPLQGKRVLVVGSGNSGAEIAADLAEAGAGQVSISIRTPPNIVRRNLGPLANQHLGIAVRRLPVGFVDRLSLIVQRVAVGDLSAHGLPLPDRGVYSRMIDDDQIPLIDVGFLSHLRAGRITVVPAVDGFDGNLVICGERKLPVDAVIAATGYRRNLESLVGHLNVLTPRGGPAVHAPLDSDAAPGLFFVGFTNPIVGNLYEISRVARRLAREIARRQRLTR